MIDSANDRRFNDTMTDLALALIDLAACTADDDLDDILADIDKLFPELADAERADLEPHIRHLIARIRN
jgi:hypothetical protein